MDLIIYSSIMEGAGERLQKMIEAVVPTEGKKICRTIEGLSHRLRQPAKKPVVAVLLANDRKDLLNILSIRDLLCDIRLILILPDREEDTLTKGHTLGPRYLTYSDSDFWEVAAVLGKML